MLVVAVELVKLVIQMLMVMVEMGLLLQLQVLLLQEAEAEQVLLLQHHNLLVEMVAVEMVVMQVMLELLEQQILEVVEEVDKIPHQLKVMLVVQELLFFVWQTEVIQVQQQEVQQLLLVLMAQIQF
jgi:hypothetical protein